MDQSSVRYRLRTRHVVGGAGSLALLVLLSGCILSAEATAARQKAADLGIEVKGAFQQVQKMLALYESVRADFKANRLGENALEQLEAARAQLDAAKERYKSLTQAWNVAKEEADKVGVPRWQSILWTIGTVGLSMAGGGGAVLPLLLNALKGRRQAQHGVKVLYGAIAANVRPNGTDDANAAVIKENIFEAVKKQVAGAACPVIEAHHQEVASAEAQDPHRKAA